MKERIIIRDYREFKWFAPAVGFTIIIFAMIFLVVFLSPREDELNRGFIPCTNKLAEDMSECDNTLCIFKAVVNDNICNFKVIGEGFSLWFKKEQPYPWSNYIFTPQIDEEQLKAKQEMQELLKIKKVD
jgi:hypothetical protein